MGNLAKLPDFIRYPELHFLEVESLHRTIQNDLPQTRQILAKLSEQGLITLHAQYMTLHSILLGYSIILSTIICCFGNGDILMVAETQVCIDELIALAEDGLQYRPLGSSSLPLILTVAWVATHETSKRGRIEELLVEYQKDFAISRWMEIAGWLEKKMDSGCRKRLAATEDIMSMQMSKTAVEECCVM